VIIRMDDTTVASPDDLQRTLGRQAIGQPLKVEILRGAERTVVVVVPAELPDAP